MLPKSGRLLAPAVLPIAIILKVLIKPFYQISFIECSVLSGLRYCHVLIGHGDILCHIALNNLGAARDTLNEYGDTFPTFRGSQEETFIVSLCDALDRRNFNASQKASELSTLKQWQNVLLGRIETIAAVTA